MKYPFEVFLCIAYYIDDEKTFKAFACVNKVANRATRHLITCHKLTKVYMAYDGWDIWKCFDDERKAREWCGSALIGGTLAICRGNVFEDGCMFAMHRVDIGKRVNKMCENKECYWQ